MKRKGVSIGYVAPFEKMRVINHGMKEDISLIPCGMFWTEFVTRLQFRMVDDKYKVRQEHDLIIGDYSGRRVILDKTHLGLYPGEIVAAVDTQDTNRVFIGHNMCFGESCVRVTFGGFVYFDDDGHQIGNMKSIANHAVFSTIIAEISLTYYCDPKMMRGINKETYLFLCGNTLVCVHRKEYKYSSKSDIHIAAVLLCEDVIQSTFSFDTSASNTLRNQFEIHLDRWLCVCDSRENAREDYFCFDLKSFQAVSNIDDVSKSDMLYDLFSVLPAAGEAYVKIDIDTALSALNSPSYEPTERDGYPIHCVKCGENTVTGEIDWGLGKAACTALGRAVCIKCCIRYSKSKGCWVCYRIVDKTATVGVPNQGPPFTCCDCAVSSPNYCCSAEHSLKAQYSRRSVGFTVAGGRNRQANIAVVVKLLPPQKRKDESEHSHYAQQQLP